MEPIVHQTCIEMLIQRGYRISTDDENGIIAINEAGKKIITLFDSLAKFNVDRVQEYVAIMKQSGIPHCIVVYQNSITPVAKKVIDELHDYKMETFEEKTLRYNITKHRLVPAHTALSKFESDIFRKRYGIKIPVLLKSDPVSRFYNFQRGDIVKIERTGGMVSFRIVK